MKKKKNQSPINDLYKLVVDYFKQETAQPFKDLFGWALFGLLGSLLIAIGFSFIVVGVIRLLQNETGSVFQGNFSWAPYLISIVGLLVLSFISFKFVQKKTTKKEKA